MVWSRYVTSNLGSTSQDVFYKGKVFSFFKGDGTILFYQVKSIPASNNYLAMTLNDAVMILHSAEGPGPVMTYTSASTVIIHA